MVLSLLVKIYKEIVQRTNKRWAVNIRVLCRDGWMKIYNYENIQDEATAEKLAWIKETEIKNGGGG